MTRFLFVAIVVAVLSNSGCFLFGRPNPQIEKISHGGDADEEVTFKYDDSGYLTEVETDDDGDTDTWELEWEDGLLVSVARTQKTGSATIESEYEVSTDDSGRIEGIELKSEDFDGDYTIEYDDDGRLSSIDVKLVSDTLEAEINVKSDVEYNDAGELSESVITTETTNGDITNETRRSSEYTFEDGILVETETTEEDRPDVTSTYEVEDGKLVKLTTETAGVDDEVEVEIAYGDDGRVETITQTTGDFTDEAEIEYGEGDARGVDMTPGTLSGVWDVTGRGYPRQELLGLIKVIGMSW